MFLQCMTEVHGCFQSGVEVVVKCQEAVMNRDSQALLREMVALKELVDQLPYVFHQISVNPNAGEQFANPVEWGQRHAKFSAPLSKHVPALSGLALPLFLLMDAFIGRTNYTRCRSSSSEKMAASQHSGLHNGGRATLSGA
jgi:hypothetical protein